MKLNWLARGIKPSRDYFIAETPYRDAIARPEVYVHIKFVADAREICEFGVAHITEFSFVNQISVVVHPTANVCENFDRFIRNGAVSFWPDIEKVVPVATCASHKIAYDGFWRFPIVIGSLITPAIIHSHTRFPGLGKGLNVLFRSGEILRYFGAVVDENVRLKLADHFVHLYGFPAIRRERPCDVVPKDV